MMDAPRGRSVGDLLERLTPIGADAQPLNSTGRADALALATELLGQVARRLCPRDSTFVRWRGTMPPLHPSITHEIRS